uniref:Uncharacterized protein n=1 Tax=Siphoviridae sp. cthSp75 TaxID=2826424 RepID=A0A8S5NEH9_9CAUD|nr:MAG TPA: hypothetical protein [Siphoviridae sp. cthSp75]
MLMLLTLSRQKQLIAFRHPPLNFNYSRSPHSEILSVVACSYQLFFVF